MVDLLSKPVSIAILIAGMLGLIVGWLVRGREVTPAPEPIAVTGLEELRWRHEKLVLTERQQVEKQNRLDEFASSAAVQTTPDKMIAALRLFVLAERVREARQKTGTDLSRMLAVRERLDTVTVVDGREFEAVKTSVRMAGLRAATLEDATQCVLVSFDSTMIRKLSAGMPIDLLCHARDSLRVTMQRRFDQNETTSRRSPGSGSKARGASSMTCLR
jgi:hypothetical protein